MMEEISQPKPELKPEEAVDERSGKFDEHGNGEIPKETEEIPEWEKKLEQKEEKKKEYEQVDELDKLIKKLDKEKEDKTYQKKKSRR